ncbi:hypothetical protein V5799_030720 [Amblyomma americanum]|uniref:Uncharacterized protein n=1 Tax=Amblyomma americanum TaxID=6943 RepID=A0AAQ4EMZ2_AMBAM
MAAPGNSKTLPILIQLDMEYTEGGSSPWFNSKGRSVVNSLTTEPRNAELFSALAHDGTMGSLLSFLDREQTSVGHVALFCYVFTGLVLLELFVLLPCASFGLRFYTATVGPAVWIACEVVLLACAGVQLMCLLSMISTWFGMKDGIGAKAPEAYQWTFELLRNYTNVTVEQLKNPAKPDKNKKLETVRDSTITGIKWLQGNLSLWDNTFDAYESLQSMLTGPIAIVQMVLLGVAIAVAVAAALLACGAWNRRKLALEAGGHSPISVAAVLITAAMLLLTHLAMTLPMIARWLPLCVLGETYLCAPYRSGALAVLDDAVAKVWPLANRPEPFCRLVPSKLAIYCTTKGKKGIDDLSICPVKVAKKALEIPPDAEEELHAILLRHDHPPLASLQKVSAEKKISGDCFYPYKIINTDLVSVCPLFTDDLVAHWMALVLSVIFGMLTAIAAGAIAAIYMAVGSKIAKTASNKVVRKRRRIRRKKKKSKKGKSNKRKKSKKKKEPSPSPTKPPLDKPPASPSTAPSSLLAVPSLVDVSVQVPVPVPVPVKTSSKHRRRRSEPPIIMLAPPPWYPPPPPVFMSPPLLTASAATPLPLAVPVASAARVAIPAGMAPTIPAMVPRHIASARCTCPNVPANVASRMRTLYMARK